MSEVCVPEWVWDDVLPHRRYAATRLVVTLLRFGSAVVGPGGERRVYLALPRGQHREADSLASRAQVSKRALDEAITDLEAAGLLTVHRSQTTGRSDGYSFPVDRPSWLGRGRMQNPHPSQVQRDAEPASSPDSPSRAIARGGGVGDPDPEIPWFEQDHSSSSTNTRARAQARAVELLGELGMSRPAAQLERFGLEAACGVLVELDATYAAGGTVAHPDGWLFAALRAGARGTWADVELVLASPAGFALPRLEDSFAARKARYGG